MYVQLRMYVGAILPPLKTTYVCADGPSPRCIPLLHSELRPSRMMNGRFPRYEFWLTPRLVLTVQVHPTARMHSLIAGSVLEAVGRAFFNSTATFN